MTLELNKRMIFKRDSQKLSIQTTIDRKMTCDAYKLILFLLIDRWEINLFFFFFFFIFYAIQKELGKEMTLELNPRECADNNI
jgi:hypothetical protein